MAKVHPKHYVPDLTSMASICEANYLRLLRLLPDMQSGKGRKVKLVGGPKHETQIVFTVTESFKYTLTIEVKQTSALHNFLRSPSMEVRLYDDVHMAEVVRYDNYHKFNGVYHYPNEFMHHPNEKQQINEFLGEWLEHCLQHGEADISLDFVPNNVKM
ncbi:DUF1249 domain-containing protein [Bermanella marisrubri]|uniref:DUF1249 domain-containing protein n=1 Tax=Bermanella marisrubri TaxID=207949 RepID=Q1N2L3_9GAMM|nr:DUF1249 domain-containing protein [Bermanella marisrubri]EAT12394.1 hypothetical protein RED65_16191 [Oceanobacter sp. RED65] [Bermanella marisrubri]